MYTFITNPNARSGLGGRVWNELEEILKQENVPYQVYFTKYQRHATQIIRDITSDGEEHTIVMLGGDGTVDEIVNGIQDLSKVTLGYIPIGSSNDFSRYFGHSRDSVSALRTVLNPSEYKEMNVGTLVYENGSHVKRFAVSAGLGFDAGVCHLSVISKMKKFLNKLHLGKLTYVSIALQHLSSLKPGKTSIILDDQEPMHFEHTYFMTAMNHPYEGGGFRFCPDADPCDDILNVTVISGLPKWKVLLLLPTAFKGWHVRFKGVSTFQCKKVIMRSEVPLPVHTDGEPVIAQTEVIASLEPEKVRIITG